MTRKIYFNTVNPIKEREIKEIFSDCDVDLRFLKNDVTEILSNDIEKVIMAKAAEAYMKCRVSIIVEHGGLLIDHLNNFPGALSKPMWDLLGPKICNLIPAGVPRTARAVSGVCYCDGMVRKVFIEETNGEIAIKGRGTNGFQWDPIFIPQNGKDETYAEMTQTEKLKYSQARKAYDKLKEHLQLL